MLLNAHDFCILLGWITLFKSWSKLTFSSCYNFPYAPQVSDSCNNAFLFVSRVELLEGYCQCVCFTLSFDIACKNLFISSNWLSSTWPWVQFHLVIAFLLKGVTNYNNSLLYVYNSLNRFQLIGIFLTLEFFLTFWKPVNVMINSESSCLVPCRSFEYLTHLSVQRS